jgi:hypothetical protein
MEGSTDKILNSDYENYFEEFFLKCINIQEKKFNIYLYIIEYKKSENVFNIPLI